MSSLTAGLRRSDQRALAGVADFSRLARIYRWLEWFTFGPFLWRCRRAFLGRMVHHRRGLVIGDGDGRFLARLLGENRRITIDAVDASRSMLAELRRRSISDSSRLHTHLADARLFEPASDVYDLVVTHFFLDCLTTHEVKRLAVRLRSSAVANANWVVSEFAVPGGCYGRALARPLISFLYQVFGWLTGLEIRRLPDHRKALDQAGWKLAHEQKLLGGLLVSEWWIAMEEDFSAY